MADVAFNLTPGHRNLRYQRTSMFVQVLQRFFRIDYLVKSRPVSNLNKVIYLKRTILQGIYLPSLLKIGLRSAEKILHLKKTAASVYVKKPSYAVAPVALPPR
jgi:hypothetical protein